MHDYCIVSSAVFCFTEIIVISTFIATCCWQSLVEGKLNRFTFSLTLKQSSLIIYKGIKISKSVKSFTFFLYVWYKTANLVVERVCKMWRTRSAEKGLKSKRKRSKTERQMNLPVCRFEGSPTTDQQRMKKNELLILLGNLLLASGAFNVILVGGRVLHLVSLTSNLDNSLNTLLNFSTTNAL